MKKYKITAIVVVIIILLAITVGFFLYKKKNTHKVLPPFVSDWITVTKGLPVFFPDIPIITPNTKLIDRYKEEVRPTFPKPTTIISGEYKYSIAGVKNSQNITPQEFYAKMFGYKRPDKNDWKVTEGASSIDAIQTGNTVHVDFTSESSLQTIIDINYVHTQ